MIEPNCGVTIKFDFFVLAMQMPEDGGIWIYNKGNTLLLIVIHFM
jgi:hypothetical protein